MKTKSLIRFSSAIIAITLLCVGQPVTAQESSVLEEVIVTAQKREQSLQDVTISITALTTETIRKLALEEYRDWADYVPGVTMFEGIDANRRTGATATIRGVTHTGRGQLQEGTASLTTAFAMGDVPIFAANPFTYDLNRLEVLRGPQGTLFGISAMGGVIRFIPNEAQTDRFEAEIGMSSGLITHGSTQYKGEFMFNVPIIEDKLAIRVAAQTRKNNGYIDVYLPPLDETNQDLEPFTGGFDTKLLEGRSNNTLADANTTKFDSIRVSLTFTPTEKFAFKAQTTWQNSKYQAVPWVDLNDSREEWNLTQFSLNLNNTEYVFSSFEASYDLGLGTLKFVGGYYNQDFAEEFPITEQSRNFLRGPLGDPLDADGLGGLPPDPYPARANFPFVTDTKIYTAELRLQGQGKNLGFHLFGDDEVTLDYVIGGYYQDETREGNWGVVSPNWNADRGPNTVPVLTEGGLLLGAQGGSAYENKSGFIDLNFNLTPKLSVGAGVRFFSQTLDGHQCSYGESPRGVMRGSSFGDDFSSPYRTNGLTGTPIIDPTTGLPLDRCRDPSHKKETGETPRFTVSYHIDDDRMVYFTAAKGQRMGQTTGNPLWPYTSVANQETNTTNTLPQCVELAESLNVADAFRNGTITDTVWSYEIGLKSYWLDRRLLLNVSAYQLDWTDYQQTLLLIQYDPFCNNIIAANVGSAEIRGMEFEAVWNATEHVSFNVAISYTDAEFVNTPIGVGSSIRRVPLKDGDSLRSVAPWTTALGVEYHRDIGQFMGDSASAYIRVDWRYVDERMNSFGDEELLRVDPGREWYFMEEYNLTDVRFGVDSGAWSMQFFVSNVFDKQVMFESTRNLRQHAIRVGSTNQPRTIGVSLSKRFF